MPDLDRAPAPVPEGLGGPPADSAAAWDRDAVRLPHANPARVRAMLAAADRPWQPFAAAGDRPAWSKVAQQLGPTVVEGLIKAGRQAAETPVPQLPASLWGTFLDSGERTGFEEPWYERRRLLADLLIAYALDPQAKVLRALLDVVWAICEETTWCFPAHDPRSWPDPRTPVVDLFAALTAISLAETLSVAGEAVPAAVVERVRDECERRVIGPYLERDDWGWLYNTPDRRVSNWGAVCAFGAVGAACYLERDEDRLATLLCKAARSMEDYLENFDPDGGTSEGVAYWSFGFGSFCQLADLVQRRTGQQWSWFEAPVVRKVAAFPLRARLGDGAWVTFSDVDAGATFSGWLLHDLATRLHIPALRELATGAAGDWTWHGANSAVTCALRSVTSPGHGRQDSPGPALEPSTWFRGLQWLISRADPADPRALSVAVKGGHNDELHNQNDVGSLIVRCGQEDLVIDPGRGRYTRDYFGDLRYEHFVNRSSGHSLPRPDALEQQAGRSHRAVVRSLQRTAALDEVSFDLRSAYPAGQGLRTLHRTVALHRGPAPYARLTDTFAFQDTGIAESGFVTFAEVSVHDGHLLLIGRQAGLRIALPRETPVEVHVASHPVELALDSAEIRQIKVRSTLPVRKASFTFTLRPHHPHGLHH